MAQLRRMHIAFLALIIPLLLGAGAENNLERIPIIKDEVYQRSKFQFVSVSQNDEVAIGFSNGVVNIYNTNGEFIYGYQFPATGASVYCLLFNEDGTIGYCVLRSEILRIYSREGLLQSEMNLHGRKDFDEIVKTTSIDSKGVEYHKKRNVIMKTYPDGTEEVFYKLYIPTKDILVIVALTPVCIYYLVLHGKKYYYPLKIKTNNNRQTAFVYGVIPTQFPCSKTVLIS